MVESIKVFISYRNLDLSRNAGMNLERELKGRGLTVFFDQTGLKRDGGVEWEKVLTDNVQTCHVLVVLVEPDTSQSTWVKREIEMARTKLAAVIPVLVLDDASKVMTTLNQLDLDGLQFLPYAGIPENVDVIANAIRARADEVMERRRREEAWQNEKTAQFRLKGAEDVLVELVTGDATTISGYDVLVNTENTYMQMARYFESRTLSCAIRRKGSLMRGGFIVDDFVQDQLNRQVRSAPEYPGTPVRILEVLVTEAGHPESELAQMDFRYILHAATVTVDPYSQRIDSIPLLAVPDIIGACLNRLESINKAGGAVLYVADGVKEAPKADYQALTSILFPLFGAGQGGNDPIVVAARLIEGFRNAIRKRKAGTAMPKLGLCVYNPDYAEPTALEFVQQGFERL
jgi:O-acetyl-ADP-ribose deacetylase (regulator of RNase III)